MAQSENDVGSMITYSVEIISEDNTSEVDMLISINDYAEKKLKTINGSTPFKEIIDVKYFFTLVVRSSENVCIKVERPDQVANTKDQKCGKFMVLNLNGLSSLRKFSHLIIE